MNLVANNVGFNTLSVEDGSAPSRLSADHPLEELFAVARTALRDAKIGCAAVLHKGMEAGDALNAAEERVHREGRSWNRELQNNCFINVRTARVYQQLARHRPEIEEAIDRAGLTSMRAALRLIAKSKDPDSDGHSEDENHGEISEEHETPKSNQGETPDGALSSDQEVVGKAKKPGSKKPKTENPAERLNGNADNHPTDLSGAEQLKPTILALWREAPLAQRDWLPDGKPGELLSDLIRILETLDAEIFRRAACGVPHLRRCLETHLLNVHGLKRSDLLTKALHKALRSNRSEDQLAALAGMNKMLEADKLDFADVDVRVPKSKK